MFLRIVWASYATAEPTKTYTFSMLISRLTVAVICTLAAGAVAELVAGRSRTVSVSLGVVLLALSAPIHLGSVWADYPPWYHFAYLLSLLPLAVVGGVLAITIAPNKATQGTVTPTVLAPEAAATADPNGRRRGSR